MENPLKQFFPVEERPDGVYIKVGRDIRDRIALPAVQTALQSAMILNADIDKIKDVVSRARGGFEKIAPPFEYYDIDFDRYVNVAVSSLKASVTVSSSCVADGKRPTERSLSHCLGRKGIRFGLLPEAISQIVKQSVFDRELVVAQGLEPVKGDKAQIKYEIDIKPNSKPRILPDGSVDFRDIQTFTQVAQGQIIAKKIPPTQGKKGMTVGGDEMLTSAGEDIVLKEGKNIAVSDDGQYLVVTKSGIIFEEGGMLNIKETLTLSKDVDYSIGNIKFTGAITINGNVQPGFVVESEDDIVIKGQVEGATIKSRNGTVKIDHGIIGKGNTVIFGKKGVHISFAQDASIATDGTLVIDKYCMHCICVCARFEMTKTGSGFIGGSIKAFEHIEAFSTGNEKDIVTKLVLTDKERSALEEKHRELTQLQQKVNDELQVAKRQLAGKAAIFKKAGDGITDRHKEELKKWIDQHNALNMKFEYVTKKLTEVNTLLEKPVDTNGYIFISGDLFPGTQLELYGQTRVIKEKTGNKRFVTRATGIETEG